MLYPSALPSDGPLPDFVSTSLTSGGRSAGLNRRPTATRRQSEEAPMDGIKTDVARAALMAKREEVKAELDRLAEQLAAFGVEQELESGGVGNHLAEDGSNVQEQEQILVISGDLNDVLTQV